MKIIWKKMSAMILGVLFIQVFLLMASCTSGSRESAQPEAADELYEQETLYANDDKNSVLDVQTQKKIKEAIWERLKKEESENSLLEEITAEDIPIRDYYGTYSGREVFTTYWGEADVEHSFYGENISIEIGGLNFEFENYFAYPYNPRFFAWEEGSLLTVEEAFYKEELKLSDIYRIAAVRGNLPENYPPLYIDVDWDEDWFSDYVFEVSMHRSLIEGLDEEHFGPHEVLSRVQFVQVLVRMGMEEYYETDEPFDDVSAEDRYVEEVSWAYRYGMITESSDHLFRPNDPISREEMAVMLYRYAVHKGYDTTVQAELSSFSDADQVSEYARDAMCWCVENGMISGNDGRLLPQENVTRAECAAVIYRFIENV